MVNFHLPIRQFEIYNVESGACLGVYPGANGDNAIRAMWRDAGYQDAHEVADALGVSIAEAMAQLKTVEVNR